ncbi:linear amide C-N hydrolase [Agarivorans sp. B2Z047]|uniref:linear amide C-N hydrolase n=1 Tax=Agarivorans sp. B2Z047 TaxID=2652721 RepID=UPI00128C9F77|nr:linear amide C-N hydrolase [Agarivorans sp. B2Z047]MPW29179.1 linear amide C-N hydrolase [Agarivorans sp. B2Z047]UQN41732.1 linear amide C-N hydrolase [Agarivorans sp. B2Z047]
MNKTLIALTIAASTFGIMQTAKACTTAAYHNGEAQVTMRTMDWNGYDNATVVGKGRGIENSYSKTDGVSSKAKYAAIKIESFTHGTVAEGINEKGLEARILYLGTAAGTQFQDDTAEVSNVDAGQVPNYVLDNFATVAEALEGLKAVEVIPTGITGIPGHEDEAIYPPVHFQLVDASGDVAVVEYIGGEMKVYNEHGASYMSNDPAFDFHLNLDKEQVEPNATIRAADRRLRAKLSTEDLYQRNVTDSQQALISMKATQAAAFSGYNQQDPYADNATFPTLWTVFTDRTNKTMMLDRAHTFAVESYSFDMFDTGVAKRVVLGENPMPNATFTNKLSN